MIKLTAGCCWNAKKKIKLQYEVSEDKRQTRGN